MSTAPLRSMLSEDHAVKRIAMQFEIRFAVIYSDVETVMFELRYFEP